MPANAIRTLYVDVKSRFRSAVTGLFAVEEAGDQARDSLEGVEQASAQTAQRMATLKAGFLATGAVAVGTAAAMGAIAQSGMEVDSVFSTVQATSGATAAEMEAIRQQTQQLGAELPIAALDAAEAFRELSFAGLSAEESIAASAGVADLAVAGNLSIADAARTTTSALNMFSMEADQAGSVANQMAGTFATSALTVDELSQAMEYVGASAAQAGQDMTEMNAAIGVLADNGLRASRAGTSLNQVLTKLASPTSKGAEAMQQLGLSTESFTDQQGDFKDMSEIVRILSDRMEGLSESQRLALLSDMFGVRGARAIGPLIDNVDELDQKIADVAAADLASAINRIGEADAEGLKEINQELESLGHAQTLTLQPDMSQREVLRQFQQLSETLSEEELTAQIQTSLDVDERSAEILAQDIEGGAEIGQLEQALNDATTAGELTAAQMETVGGKIEYVRGSISSFAYTAYGTFKPAISAGLDVLVGFVDILTANDQIAAAFGATLLTVGAAATVAALAFGAMALELWATQTAAYAAGQGMYTATAASKVLGAAQFVLANGLRASAAAAWSLMAPMWPLLAVALAGAAAIYAYQNNLLGFADAVDGTVGLVGDFVGWLWGLVDVVSGLIGWFDSLGMVGKAGILAILAPIAPVLAGLLLLREGIKLIGPAFDIAGGAANWFFGLLAWGLNAVVGPFAWAIGGTADALGTLYSWIVGAGAAYRSFTNDIQNAVNPLNLFGGAVNWVIERVQSLIGWLDQIPSASDIPLIGGALDNVFGGDGGEQDRGGQGGGQDGGNGRDGGPPSPPSPAQSPANQPAMPAMPGMGQTEAAAAGMAATGAESGPFSETVAQTVTPAQPMSAPGLGPTGQTATAGGPTTSEESAPQPRDQPSQSQSQSSGGSPVNVSVGPINIDTTTEDAPDRAAREAEQRVRDGVREALFKDRET